MEVNARVVKIEDKLLASYRSYRGTRIGAIFLFVMFLLALCIEVPRESANYNMESWFFAMMIFWAAVESFAKAKLDHIATIKRYRRIVDTQGISQPDTSAQLTD